MNWTHILVTLIGHNRILGAVVVIIWALKQAPMLIAKFRVAIARKDDTAKRARKALKAIDPAPWHWIWQKRG